MPDHERTTVTHEPERVIVHRGGSTAGWWVAAIVAIVAIFGVILVMNGAGPTRDDLQAAREPGAVQANVANATVGAQQSAAAAAQAAQDAATGAARATESAAQAAAARTTQAADATADTIPTEPDPR